MTTASDRMAEHIHNALSNLHSVPTTVPFEYTEIEWTAEDTAAMFGVPAAQLAPSPEYLSAPVWDWFAKFPLAPTA